MKSVKRELNLSQGEAYRHIDKIVGWIPYNEVKEMSSFRWKEEDDRFNLVMGVVNEEYKL